MTDIKLGKRQWEMLDAICKTNGGGVYSGTTAETRRLLRLYELGLVQGKSGHPTKAVHTREGWELWKRERESRSV